MSYQDTSQIVLAYRQSDKLYPGMALLKFVSLVTFIIRFPHSSAVFYLHFGFLINNCDVSLHVDYHQRIE